MCQTQGLGRGGGGYAGRVYTLGVFSWVRTCGFHWNLEGLWLHRWRITALRQCGPVGWSWSPWGQQEKRSKLCGLPLVYCLLRWPPGQIILMVLGVPHMASLRGGGQWQGVCQLVRGLNLTLDSWPILLLTGLISISAYRERGGGRGGEEKDREGGERCLMRWAPLKPSLPLLPNCSPLGLNSSRTTHKSPWLPLGLVRYPLFNAGVSLVCVTEPLQ